MRISFDTKSIKDSCKNDMDNIRDYGHPHYNAFESMLSKCKKFEIIVYVNVGSKQPGGKFGYQVEAQIFELAEDCDLDDDDYFCGAKLVHSTEERCRTRTQVWETIAELTAKANEIKNSTKS